MAHINAGSIEQQVLLAVREPPYTLIGFTKLRRSNSASVFDTHLLAHRLADVFQHRAKPLL